MKKIIFILTTFVCTGSLFALPDFALSAGGGGLFNAQWKTGLLRDEYKEYGIGGSHPNPTQKTQDAMLQGLFDTKDSR
ncbi:MAG: hypothetical protein LBD20_03745 [Spirochaetaceae bacterium]|jgi:hypothetical protein|nr:hypothetical protein [Spirochaetaceae bacterium]